MATYKTPDVYIKEISLFPPSVAEVETAVPAFIGYTEKALKNGVEDVGLIPTEVDSLVEYESIFGKGPDIGVNTVELDANNIVTKTELDSTFYLYDSLRLFFNNGGGKCYIISVGSYTVEGASPSKTHFLNGLDKLKKVDEPTIILFPDAILLDTDLYEVQVQALDQCNALQDRFCVFDLLEKRSLEPNFDWEEGIDEFRDEIGMNYLMYGAAYTPYLKTNLTKNVRYKDIKSVMKKSGSSVTFDELTTDADVINAIELLDDALEDNAIINGTSATVGSIKKFLSDNTLTSLEAGYNNLVVALRARVNVLLAKTSITAADITNTTNGSFTLFKALFTYIYKIVDTLIDDWAQPISTIALNDDANTLTVIDTVRSLIAGTLHTAIGKLNGYNHSPNALIGGTASDKAWYSPSFCSFVATQWGTVFTSVSQDNTIYTNTGTTNTDKVKNVKAAEPTITAIFKQVSGAIDDISKAAGTYVDTYENALKAQFPLFANIIKKVGAALTVMPPSGAVAGVYAKVDNDRGVWKAPANVSLNRVSGLTETIDNKDQEDLNVDVVAGKSVNAIRSFTGKGTLIWGARTLAGNDNEWRYVPVRRFFNMVEESVKKSTYWAVFEPNTANTWVKVKAMIENYLTLKWRDGALAGAIPSDAFYVKVGLGSTMTALDILEGRMNVEIGMAAVRPAEFIILKFSHMMQES